MHAALRSVSRPLARELLARYEAPITFSSVPKASRNDPSPSKAIRSAAPAVELTVLLLRHGEHLFAQNLAGPAS